MVRKQCDHVSHGPEAVHKSNKSEKGLAMHNSAVGAVVFLFNTGIAAAQYSGEGLSRREDTHMAILT